MKRFIQQLRREARAMGTIAPKMTETQLVRLCINYLLTKGHYVWRNNSGGVRSKYTSLVTGQVTERFWRAGVKGSSDILGIAKDGRFIAVECKVGKNDTTDLQDLFLHEILRRGGIGIVAYDIDDLQRAGL
jgi:hypothetical protein